MLCFRDTSEGRTKFLKVFCVLILGSSKAVTSSFGGDGSLSASPPPQENTLPSGRVDERNIMHMGYKGDINLKLNET